MPEESADGVCAGDSVPEQRDLGPEGGVAGQPEELLADQAQTTELPGGQQVENLQPDLIWQRRGYFHFTCGSIGWGEGRAVWVLLGARLWSARGCENLAGNLSRSGKQQQYQTSPNHVRAILGCSVH